MSQNLSSENFSLSCWSHLCASFNSPTCTRLTASTADCKIAWLRNLFQYTAISHKLLNFNGKQDLHYRKNRILTSIILEYKFPNILKLFSQAFVYVKPENSFSSVLFVVNKNFITLILRFIIVEINIFQKYIKKYDWIDFTILKNFCNLSPLFLFPPISSLPGISN